MFAKRHLFNILTIMFVGLLLFAQPLAKTKAQEGEPETASGSIVITAANPSLAAVVIPGGPGFFSANGLMFQPWPDGTIPMAFSGRSVYNPDTSSHAYEASVSLPHGAVITKFVVWGVDSDATLDFWAALAKMGQDDSEVAQIGRIDSSGNNPATRVFTDTTISSPVVDLQSYAYWVEIFLPPGSTVRVTSFRVDYNYPTFAPLILRE